MAESKRNEKAAQQQQARAKAVEVTMRDGKFSGLTKRNGLYEEVRCKSYDLAAVPGAFGTAATPAPHKFGFEFNI